MSKKLSTMIKEKEKRKSDKKNFGGTPSLINIINAYLSNRSDSYFHPFKAEVSRNELIGFHPSGLHNACPRQIAFGFIHEKMYFTVDILESEFDHSVLPPKVKMRFDFGHIVHMLIQYGYLPDYDKNISKAELAVEKLYNDFLIGGTVDLNVNMQDARWRMWDIKTIRTELFRKLKTYADVETSYKVQFNIYLFGLKIQCGGVLYVDKNDCEMKEFLFDYDSSIIKEPMLTAKKAKAFLEGKSVPPILTECTQKKGRYKNCKYSSICFRCKTGNDLLKFTTATSHNQLVKKEYKADVEKRIKSKNS